MYKTISFLTVVFISLFILSEDVLAQSSYVFTCGTPNTAYNGPVIMDGQFKPVKTPPENDTSAYLRCLVVFAEFKDDNSYPTSQNWPPGEPPIYIDEMFAETKNLNGYADYSISDYWDEISHGEFDVIADVYHIILPYDYNHYNNDIYEVHRDVYKVLDTTLYVDWRRYDKWRWNINTQEYENIGDDYIDMMVIQHRSVDMFGATYGGIAGLFASYNTLNYGKYIDGGASSYEASGFTGIDGAIMWKGDFTGLCVHEYSHFAVLMAHRPYSKVAGGYNWENTWYGGDLAFSPQDLFVTGLDVTTIVDFSSPENYLNDMVTTGELLKVPISAGQSPSEYFYVCNRRKLSLYDIVMFGDTTMGTLYAPAGNYGKGVYIYHVSNGTNYNWYPDLEAADGLWDWEFSHNTTPDWSETQQLPVLFKTNVNYVEDNPTTGVYDNSRMFGRDGLSVTNQNYGGTGYHTKWFTPGKRHENLGEQGIDRIFTNLEEDWCSRECMGDRWDPWNIDYNVVFSPYSSPNTNDRNNNPTGIFIYYESLDGSTANLKIYKTDVGYTEDEILELTPPSKPMDLVLTYTECIDGKSFPVLTWHHNMEPDMKVPPEPILYQFKRYKIFRAVSGISNVPDDYEQIADTSLRSDLTPTFIDYDAYLDCEGGLPVYNYQVRYKIRAVDKDELESVYSDFAATPASIIQKPGGNYLINPNNSPKTFSLLQNYPNPFNPSTEIRYSIPSNGFVTLKVYNILGEEVVNLVGESKEAGEYSITFDGSNLASGVYFYKLEIGAYTAVKKMVLVK